MNGDDGNDGNGGNGSNDGKLLRSAGRSIRWMVRTHLRRAARLPP